MFYSSFSDSISEVGNVVILDINSISRFSASIRLASSFACPYLPSLNPLYLLLESLSLIF